MSRLREEQTAARMTESVCAVVVTHRRPDELAKSLDAVGAQTRAPDHLVVIDNENTSGASTWDG